MPSTVQVYMSGLPSPDTYLVGDSPIEYVRGFVVLHLIDGKTISLASSNVNKIRQTPIQNEANQQDPSTSKRIRGFKWNAMAWYSATEENESISFGLYDPGKSTTGEAKMVWLGKSPRLECFDDSWASLYSFSDVLERMSKRDNQDISQQEFVALLISCGFTDLTDYTNKR